MAEASINVELCDVFDATIISIWRRIYSYLDTKDIVQGMLVCSSFSRELPSLVTKIQVSGHSARTFGQRHLGYLARTFTNVQHLSILAEYDDDAPVLDFSNVKFPALEILSMNCKGLARCCFTRDNTPQLKSLSIDNGGTFRDFKLDLPHLTSLSFEFTQVDDARGFGPSLSKCPQLQRFSSYKLWGLSGGGRSTLIHKLHLPECTSLELSRSDDLEGLELWAPKLRMLNLRACYALDHVRLMDDPPGTQSTPLTVNMINANIDRTSKLHLKQHPRVKAGAVWTKESQEWGGLAGELGFGADDMDEPDSDDLDEEQALEDMMGFPGNIEGPPGFPFMMGGGFGGPAALLAQLAAGGMLGQPGFLAAGLGAYAAAGMDMDEDVEEDEDEWETASDEEPGEGEEPDEGDGGRHDTGTGLSCVIEEVE